MLATRSRTAAHDAARARCALTLVRHRKGTSQNPGWERPALGRLLQRSEPTCKTIRTRVALARPRRMTVFHFPVPPYNPALKGLSRLAIAMMLSRWLGIANLSPCRRWAAPMKGWCLLDVMSYSVGVAFRKLASAAAELLECLVKSRAAAERAHQSGSAFDWKTPAEQLEMLEDGLSFYWEPAKPAVEKATPGKTLTIAEVDANTGLDALQRLACNTVKAFWIFLNMTKKGTEKLVIPSDQTKLFEETVFLASITALAPPKVRELRRQLEREIADAKIEALADVALHPGEVARSKYDAERLKRFWSDIGHEPNVDDESRTVPQLVKLDQMASIVNRNKKTLERFKAKMPPPDIDGGGGKPDEWNWATVRPLLQEQYNRVLPERFPALKR